MSARLSPNTWTLILPSGKNQVQVRLEPSPGCPSSLKIFNRYSCVYSDFIFDSMFIPANTCADSSLCIRIYTYISVYICIYTIYVYYLCCMLLFRSLSPQHVLWLFYLLKNDRVLRWHANPVLTGRDSMGVYATCMGERGKGK
jgi:hypothetical protein